MLEYAPPFSIYIYHNVSIIASQTMTCFPSPKMRRSVRIIFRAAARAQVIPDIHVHHATESKGSIAFHLKVHDLTVEDIDDFIKGTLLQGLQ